MEKEAEKFLEAEKIAIQLVETLKQLHSETVSYQTATKELDIVRKNLLNLIDSTKGIVNSSYEIIKVLKEIDGVEILNRIKGLEEYVSKKFSEQSFNIEVIKKELVDGLAGHKKDVKKLKTLLIIILANSIIAIIVELLTFLK